MRFISILLFAIILAGCASTKEENPTLIPEENYVENTCPEIAALDINNVISTEHLNAYQILDSRALPYRDRLNNLQAFIEELEFVHAKQIDKTNPVYLLIYDETKTPEEIIKPLISSLLKASYMRQLFETMEEPQYGVFLNCSIESEYKTAEFIINLVSSTEEGRAGLINSLLSIYDIYYTDLSDLPV